MHGREGEERRSSWHMLPVPPAHRKAAGNQQEQQPPPPSPRLPLLNIADSNNHDFFLKDGRKIFVGDCALFQSGNSPAFIGIIRWFLSNKEGSLKLGVNWLYRPADVKLAKGTFLEAAPNEVFYSFHKDEISVQSLLHPCKVAFLRKDVELPSSISSFVCRRVYDIANKCLWWLTDQDYINERQEEVDHLLERTRLEMHATAVQSGNRSPKPLNGSSSQQLKTGSDNIQNSSTSGSLQGKGKRKEKVEQGSETIKKDIAPKVENEDSNNCIVEGKLKADITKIAEKGALLNCEGVDKLVQLMQTDKSERKIDLSGRIMLADVIASTDSVDCLGRFVQLRAVPVLDDWLQEAHKGKVGDSNCLKENDKSVDELLLALLRALDKLPVNLHVLQTSSIGKSVNNLRGHKNLEIHKKARSLVDTWKKRVDAEMTKRVDAEMTMINDMKPVGSSQTIPWSAKSGFSEVCQGNRHTGSSDLAARMSHTPSSSSKILPVKVGHGDHLVKSPSAPTGSSKLPLIAPSSVGICSKDVQCKVTGISGSSELQLAKEEKSSGSSQSQNNSQSCSSGQAKTLGTATKEDAKSSTAGSTKASKTSGGVSRHKRSSNGFQGTTVSRSDKEANVGKSGPFSRNTASSRVSQPGLTSERSTDISALDHGNGHRLIVRLPNPGRTPAQSTGSGPIEEHPSVDSRASSPAASEKHEQNDQKVKVKGGSASQAAVASCATSESWKGNETKGSLPSDGGQLSGALNETHMNKGENEKSGDELKVESMSSANENELLLTDSKLGKSYHPSFSSIHALIESCVKYSECGASLPDADDNGMNLLASVAAGQLCKSDLICPASSPIRCSPMQEDHSNVDKAEPEFSSPGEHDDRVNEASEKHKGSDLHKEESSKLVSRNSQHNVILQEHKPTEEHELSMISRGKHDEEPDVGEDHMSSSAGQAKNDDMEISGANKLLDKLMLDMQFNSELLDSKHNLGNSLSERLSSGDCAQEKIAKHCTSLEDCGDNTHATSDKASLNEEVRELQPCPSNMVVQHTLVNEESTAVADTNQQLLSSSAVKHEVIGSIQNESSSSISAVSNPEPLKNVLPGNTNGVGTGNHSGPHDSGKEQLPAHSRHSILVSCTVKKDLHKDEVYKHLTDVSAKVEEVPSVPTLEVEQSPNSTSSRVVGCEGHESELACHADGSILHNSLEPDSAAKRGFDLNEGIAAEEASHGEKSISFPLKCSPAVLHPVLTPFTVSPVSGGSVPVTVAAPAKGPFVPPEDLFVYRDKLGWKGSAATSAFRPAEPRRLFEMPLNSSEAPSDTAPGKQIRAGLDIDLNVADVQVQEDIASQSSAHSESGGATAFTCVRNVGLDLDLNKVDEITETGQVPESSSRVLEEATFLPVKSSSGASTNGEVGAPRDFDLNDGPSLDEVGGGPVTRNQLTKNNSMPFVAPGGLRMSNAELGNLSPWFLPGNTYSAVAIPSFMPDRGDQAYPLVTPAGTQRFMGSATGSFVGDIYRNPVLSSSPAMVFSPAATFPYASFPFGSSFPLGSTSITGGPTTSYVDSSSGGGPGFPTIPPQLVGSPNAVTPAYIRPNMMSLQECSTSGGSEGSRKWGRQSLDLNAGPGIIDFEGRDERLASSRQMSLASSHAFAEEQARIHQIANGTLKRKEPEGGWDMDRYSYKQHSWQ